MSDRHEVVTQALSMLLADLKKTNVAPLVMLFNIQPDEIDKYLRDHQDFEEVIFQWLGKVTKQSKI